ncbi:hypothetical protein INS49_008850 [Diaporthe citri]|uniref:uncharacterized protein n=1 Tax=Diaporthe citri TaxID=83186 RepID=UPI001C7FD9A3|nr:uncharacterized protein INS49_008850 [Diaporthe citri]KAG6363747.1 hypothetical protein INS49_008850 [Diaporthe citri]
MLSPSPKPNEAKQSGKPYLSARAAELKQKLMQSRLQAASAQPADMSSSEGVPGQCKQQKQPISDGAEPVQTKTSALDQAQSIPGLSQGTSQSKKPSNLNAPDQLNGNDKVQGSPDIYEKLMEKLSSPTPSKTTGKDANDITMTVNEVGRDIKAPPGTNAHAAAKANEKPDNRARSKAQRGGDSTARKETPASRSGTKSPVVPKEKASTLSSTEEGEITSKPPAPTRKIPVQESTPKPASRKTTPPTRLARPSLCQNKEKKTRVTPALLIHPRPSPTASADMAVEVHLTPARADKATTTPPGGAYMAPPPPFPHHVYARPGREQRPHPTSPVASLPIEDRDWEIQSFDFRDRDLRDWLRLTGWDSRGFRLGELARLRRQEQIDRESAELKAEGEREKARLKEEFAEGSKASHPSGARPRPLLLPPAPPRRGIKRERGEESDGDADGDSSAKYYRTNRSHRGSRAGYHGYHHRGRENSRQRQAREDRQRSDRFSPSRDFADSPPSQSHPQRHPRQRFLSPVGHPLPRDEFDAQRAIDRYVTRDRQPPRHHSPRPSSSTPWGRGHKSSCFHESEYGRLSGPPN